MSRSDTPSESRPWGIAVRMPAGDPMSAPHLLGEDWSGNRWYASEAERDSAMADMRAHPPWYRRGDSPSVQLEKINPSR